MGVACQDYVNPRHVGGQFLVHVKAVVRQHHHQPGPRIADLLHHFGHSLFAHAKGQVGEHPLGVGNRQIGEGLPDHSNLDAAAFEHLVRLVGRFFPFGVKDVRAKEGKIKTFDNLGHPVDAQREFEMRGHGVGLQEVHDIDHILPAGFQTGVRPVPSIAAIQQKRVRARGADRLDHGCHAVQAAHLAVALRQCAKIVKRQGMGLGRPRRQTEFRHEILARDMRNLALGLADTEVDFRLAEPDRFQLGVNVGNVD